MLLMGGDDVVWCVRKIYVLWMGGDDVTQVPGCHFSPDPTDSPRLTFTDSPCSLRLPGYRQLVLSFIFHVDFQCDLNGQV